MQHPQVPWISIFPAQQGGFIVQDDRTGEQAWAPTEEAVHQFAADHSSAPGYMGAGDMVHAVTSRLGMQRCAPCAQRQTTMNRWAPSLFRRR